MSSGPKNQRREASTATLSAWSDLRAAAVPALACLALYLAQAPTVSGDKDGSEFTLVLALGGVAHPTGYPVFTVCGHLFARALHALGAGWPWAANAWSAVGGAAAVLFLFALCLRLMPAELDRRARLYLATLPTALFALDPIWTYEATLAEVYSWHLAWVGACAFCFLLALEAVESSGEWRRGRGLGMAAAWGLLCGLGGAHHTTALFVAAPLSIALFGAARSRGRAGAREAVVVVAAALLPLASYLFVPWRAFHPAAWQWPTLAADWTSVRQHLTGAPYQHFLGSFAPASEQRDLLARYVYPVLFPALAASAWGALSAADRQARLRLWPLAAAALLSTAYAFSYGVPDPSSYFVAPMALAAACGAVACARSSGLRRVGAPLAVGAGVAVLALGAAWIDTGARRREVFGQFDRRVRSMWESVTFDRAIVLWPNDMYLRLVEYQQLRGEKPEVEVLNPVLLTNPLPRERFRARHGFDPLEGTDPAGADADLDRWAGAVGRAINERTPLPVILFDPQTESVRMLRKR